MKRISDFSKSPLNIFHSCCGGSGHNHNAESQTHGLNNQAEGYQCPMHCEGNKIYEQLGNCPVCNMKLAPVGENVHEHEHEHEHDHGGSYGCCG